MNRFKDFDLFFTEMNREPLRLRIFGEDHELPATLPVKIVLLCQRLQNANPDEIVADGEIFEIFRGVFGKDRANKWIDEKALDVEQMSILLQWAMEQYGVNSTSPKAPKVQQGKRSAK